MDLPYFLVAHGPAEREELIHPAAEATILPQQWRLPLPVAELAAAGHGLRRMGYRLVPLEVTLPKSVRAGEPVALDMTWINRAVGRSLRDYTLRVRLVQHTTARDGGHKITIRLWPL